MSMALVSAQLSLFGPSAGATDAKSYSSCVVASSSARLVFQPHLNCGDRKGYISLSCRASSGGSRRDYEKILARQQGRRVRHMKGVTPTTPDLINTLDSEKRDQAKLDAFPDASNDKKEYDLEDNEDHYDEKGIPLPLDEGVMFSPDILRASHVGDEHVANSSEDNEGLKDRIEETTGAFTDAAVVREDPTADRA